MQVVITYITHSWTCRVTASLQNTVMHTLKKGNCMDAVKKPCEEHHQVSGIKLSWAFWAEVWAAHPRHHWRTKRSRHQRPLLWPLLDAHLHCGREGWRWPHTPSGLQEMLLINPCGTDCVPVGMLPWLTLSRPGLSPSTQGCSSRAHLRLGCHE